MSSKILLISIRPEFAKKIFKGTKKVELRRLRPRTNKGDIIAVYVSSPVKAIIGGFEVDKVVEDAPHILWSKVKSKAGVTQEQFNDYYEGATLGFGIFLDKIWGIPKPIGLKQLRAKWSNFHPPQSYHYLPFCELREVGFHLTEFDNWNYSI